MFSDECFINFKGSFERGTGFGGNYMIAKDKVIVKDETSGLIPILITTRKEKTSNILIDGAIDVEAGTFFSVPNEEIVYDKN